jgi:AraC-like DNA-binding protein
VDELRHKMALEYLNGKKVSVNETAYLVGFSEPAAFSRAFKRWTGRSPGEYTGRASAFARFISLLRRSARATTRT